MIDEVIVATSEAPENDALEILPHGRINPLYLHPLEGSVCCFVGDPDPLLEAEAFASDPALREHVGIHISQHPERFRILNLEAPSWLRYPDVHLEVDTPAEVTARRDFQSRAESTGFSR